MRVDGSVVEVREGGSLRAAVWLAVVFAVVKVAVQVVANVFAQRHGYEIFRDELYYIVCGRNLAWGYLDQPPMAALEAHVAEVVFGLRSVVLFRLIPDVLGGVGVGLAGLLAWAMGGRRVAQGLAMLGVLCSPMCLGVDGNLSMNGAEPVFWEGIALLLVLLLRGWVRPAVGWVGIGVLAGLGIENKWNIAFFAVAMFAGVVLSPQRGVLRSRWVLVGTAVALLLAAPNFVWEIERHWPTLEWLRNDAAGDKNIHLGPVAFVREQVEAQNRVGLLLWGAGVVWFLFGTEAKKYRSFGLMFLVYLPMMIAMHAKDYYLSAVYPMLFAGGGVAWAMWLRGRWRMLMPVYALLLLVWAGLAFPLALPVLSPEGYVAYTRRIGLKTPETQTFDHAALPQYFADQRGWRRKADAMADAYLALSPEDRAKAVIYTTNYGGASAVNVYRRDVPVAVSGHQNYWFWGPRGHTGEVMVIYGDGRKTDEEEFRSVTDVPWAPDPWTEPYEQKTIYVCQGAKGWTLAGIWPRVKVWY